MNWRKILLLVLIFYTQTAPCKQIQVCPSCNLSDLEQAIEHARVNDTIIVEPGSYAAHNLAIDKPLTLIGRKGAILDGGGESYVFRLLADSITVSGFELINSGRSFTKDYAAIYTSGAANFQIINNAISASFFGILLEKSRHGVIQGNTVTGKSTREDQSGNGIHLWNCKGIEISDNEVFGMRDGIYLEFVDSSNIHHNYTHNNVRYGLHFMFSNHDAYTNNTFENNGAGVAVMFSKWIVMRENRFLENWGAASYGLLLKEIYDGEVVNNLFEENTIAIFIDGSTRINYKKNTFRQNGWAIKVSGGCYLNHFMQNNFIGNAFDVSYNSRMNDNSFDHNYWSDYNGYDLDKDGIGDVPYRPVKLFSYIVNNTPETIILLRSLFVDIINFSEHVSPVFTPDDLQDSTPSIRSFL